MELMQIRYFLETAKTKHMTNCCLCLPVIAPVDEVDNYVGRYDDQIQEIYDQYIVKSVVIEFG